MALEVSNRRLLSVVALLGAVVLGASGAALGVCGPFTDVTDATFCPFVLEIFTLGITTGTTPTTYDPASPVSRLQMAAFLSRTVDGVLKRGSRRAAARKHYIPQVEAALGLTTIGGGDQVQFDGADLWIANPSGFTVARVRASDGKLLETWTGASGAQGVVVAMGRVVLCGGSPGKLLVIDPRQAAGAVTTVVSTLPVGPAGIDFDGTRFWTANTSGSVSMITPGASIPWTSANVNITTGSSSPVGVVFDGSNIWVTDGNANTIVKLDSSGTVLQTVTVGTGPLYPAFDGANIWVPNFFGNSMTVVRASNGVILQTLTGNGLNGPYQAAFDGERILATNEEGGTVSLWKAADLTPLGVFSVGAASFPRGAASDGLNFWIVAGVNLARF